MLLFVKLFLAHIVGDFIFQPKAWAQDKNRKKFKSAYLYLHFVIHGILVYLLTASLPITAAIVITHSIIDIIKIYNVSVDNSRKLFFYDQLSHMVVILAISLYASGIGLPAVGGWFIEHLLIITSVIFLTLPTSIIIENAISRWDPDSGDKSPDSLERAGAYIGVLERLFVFVFVISGQWNAVGFLIAAKSVFRFGDLKESHDRKLTEYILIGTLMSVGIASIVGVLVRYFS